MPREPPAGGPPPRAQLSADDRAALVDARIAGLKAGLKLTAEQEKLWPPVEKAIRDTATNRQARVEDARKQRDGAATAGRTWWSV